MARKLKAAKLALAFIVLSMSVSVFFLESLTAHYTLTKHSDPSIEATLSILNGLLALWSGAVLLSEMCHKMRRESSRDSLEAPDIETLTSVGVSSAPTSVSIMGYATGRWRAYRRETQSSQR